jgi:hypothetical protein
VDDDVRSACGGLEQGAWGKEPEEEGEEAHGEDEKL